MGQLFLSPHKLYILSGIPASGKSSLLARSGIPASMVVSSDDIRDRVLGSFQYAENGEAKEGLYAWGNQNPLIFSIIEASLKARLSERLTTFLDLQALDDETRSEYVKMAASLGIESEILILDVDEELAASRNAARARKVDPAVVVNSAKKLKKDSKHPHRIVRQDDVLVLKTPSLDWNGGKWDVVGDIHALLPETKRLLAKAGYDLSNGYPEHPAGRRLLFLGDIIDRGIHPVETIEFMRKAVKMGHVCLMGNHEHKLVRFWRNLGSRGVVTVKSLSGSETADALMRLPHGQREAAFSFVSSLPHHFEMTGGSGTRFAFAHADLLGYDPAALPLAVAVYGSRKLDSPLDSDAVYSNGVKMGLSSHVLVRGHIPPTSAASHAFSLDRQQAFGGELLLLRMDDFDKGLSLAGPGDAERNAAFDKALVTEKVSFNYDDHVKGAFGLKFGLQALVGKKLVTNKVDESSGLVIWKYSKKVFWDHLWNADPLLKKARGLVTDMAGKIVQHPFDKIFNFGEEGTGEDIPDGKAVRLVEKMNGFLGCITKHPYKDRELLVTTTGSFDSDFVGYVRDYLSPETKGRLFEYLSKNDKTLTFEVLHPKDPHIIEYAADSHGLWLIGARDKAFDATQDSEEELDSIGAAIGVRRPSHFETTFGEAKRLAKESELEGFIVRDAETGAPLLKFKTDYYLVTKFIGRMGHGNIMQMFANPRSFVEKLDEEFEPLVGLLTKKFTKDSFLALGKDERVSSVRAAIAEMRDLSVVLESGRHAPSP